MSKRYYIQLDAEHSAKLEGLAARTHVQAVTLARSLLSTAIDEADPDPAVITEREFSEHSVSRSTCSRSGR